MPSNFCSETSTSFGAASSCIAEQTAGNSPVGASSAAFKTVSSHPGVAVRANSSAAVEAAGATFGAARSCAGRADGPETAVAARAPRGDLSVGQPRGDWFSSTHAEWSSAIVRCSCFATSSCHPLCSSSAEGPASRFFSPKGPMAEPGGPQVSVRWMSCRVFFSCESTKLFQSFGWSAPGALAASSSSGPATAPAGLRRARHGSLEVDRAALGSAERASSQTGNV